MMILARLLTLLRDLRSWVELAGFARKAVAAHPRRIVSTQPRKRAPNLRPPTLMIDLLFGALMLFAFQIGAPKGETAVSHQFELPTAAKEAGSKPSTLLPLTPIAATASTWIYRVPDGKELTPAQVKRLADNKNLVPVLVVPKTMPVQEFIDAEQPLRQLGVTVGLAVKPGESK